MACFPSAPDPIDRGVAAYINEEMDNAPDSELQTQVPVTVNMNTCPGHPVVSGAHAEELQKKDAENFMNFLKSLGQVFDQVVDKNGGFKTYVSNAYDCQYTCVEATLGRAFQNVWETGLFNKGKDYQFSKNAIRGALRACYPGLNTDIVDAVATDVVAAAADTLAKPGDDHPAKMCLSRGHEVMGMKYDQFQDGFDRVFTVSLEGALKAVMYKGHTFKEAVEHMGDCQWDCMLSNVKQIGDLWWGTQKYKLPDAEQKEQGIQAITGAFMACYPGAPRDHVLTVAAHISDRMEHVSPEEIKGANKPVEIDAQRCPGAPPGMGKDVDESKTEWNNFLQNLGSAFQDADAATPKFHEFMKGTYACQSDCLSSTMQNALTNLWQAGLFGQEEGSMMSIKSITGAIKTCYPALDHAVAYEFSENIMKSVNAELDKVTRLYPSIVIPHIAALQAAERRQVPTVAIAAAGVAVVGAVAFVALARKRMRAAAAKARDCAFSDEECLESLE